MKTWYCVTSSYDNKGRVTAAITATRDAEEQPESSYTSTTHKDIYNDWVESMEKAERFVADALSA